MLGFDPNSSMEKQGVSLLITFISGTTDDERIRKLFYAIASECMSTPNPEAEQFPIDAARINTSNEPVLVEFIGLLEDENYYDRVLSLLHRSTSRIWVCMFHISSGNDDHPTTKLLEALGAAKKRGVDVKVIMDQDLKTDPYLSTIINSEARRCLTEQGVLVKFDTSDKLLHSKVVLIDNEVTILGSHNWTHSAFHVSHEDSLAVNSPQLAMGLGRDFERLWTEGARKAEAAHAS
ncbi:MAG: hypothetical protein EOP50_17935 [Sphingobacteriales bacterium]|nr:MAG: hypothetical protein EOP50_17935 [Sphingobacteriales bacterium]